MEERLGERLRQAAILGDLTALHAIADQADDDVETVFQSTDQDGNTALHLAAIHGHSSFVKTLLEDYTSSCDSTAVNNNGDTPLHCAAREEKKRAHWTCMDHLVENYEIDLGDSQKLHWELRNAASRGDIDKLKHLIQDNLNLNETFEDGNTALHVAAQSGKTTCLKYLIKQNPELNAKNNKGNTPLHLAALNGNTACVNKLLTTDGVNVNEINLNGDTPLHLALSKHRTDCVKNLLNNQNVTINIQNNAGDSPLHIAIREKESVMTLLSLNRRPNTRLQNMKRQTPFDVAVAMSFDQSILNLLQ